MKTSPLVLAGAMVLILLAGGGYYLSTKNIAVPAPVQPENASSTSPVTSSSTKSSVTTQVTQPASQRIGSGTHTYTWEATSTFESLPVISSNQTCDTSAITCPNPENEVYSGYAKDASSIYYLGEKLGSADYASFVLVRGSLTVNKDAPTLHYAKDKNHVYYDGTILPGANPLTFKALENGAFEHSYGTDGKTVYYQAIPIPSADPTTFKILWQTVYEGCIAGDSYSLDANHVYYNASLVVGADPATFQGLITYSKDKHGYYLNGVFFGTTVNQQELDCTFG